MRNLGTKKEIRQLGMRSREGIPLEKRQAFSLEIQKKVAEHPFYLEAEEIYCYVAFRDEVSTSFLLETSWEMGKKVAVPKVFVDKSSRSHQAGAGHLLRPGTEGKLKVQPSMEFYYINRMEELSGGYNGILEPRDTRHPAEGNHVLVIMPGLAFDPHGGRIGYGGGFYDAYLRRHPHYRRMALAYSAQCFPEVFQEPWDIRPEWIITEKETYIC